ncbi:hypothetical protein EJB05_38866, partial [Eragrostis curvula]
MFDPSRVKMRQDLHRACYCLTDSAALSLLSTYMVTANMPLVVGYLLLNSDGMYHLSGTTFVQDYNM